MSLLIKGMEMPEENHDYGGVKVWVDLRVYTDGSVSCRNLAGDFVDLGKCAVEVPTPHGRLIDVKALERMDFSNWIMQGDVGYVPFMEVSAAIFNAPTVIESEEG